MCAFACMGHLRLKKCQRHVHMLDMQKQIIDVVQAHTSMSSYIYIYAFATLLSKETYIPFKVQVLSVHPWLAYSAICATELKYHNPFMSCFYSTVIG